MFSLKVVAPSGKIYHRPAHIHNNWQIGCWRWRTFRRFRVVRIVKYSYTVGKLPVILWVSVSVLRIIKYFLTTSSLSYLNEVNWLIYLINLFNIWNIKKYIIKTILYNRLLRSVQSKISYKTTKKYNRSKWSVLYEKIAFFCFIDLKEI